MAEFTADGETYTQHYRKPAKFRGGCSVVMGKQDTDGKYYMGCLNDNTQVWIGNPTVLDPATEGGDEEARVAAAAVWKITQA